MLKLIGDWAPINRKIEKLSFSGALIANLEGSFLSDCFARHAPVPKAGPSLYNNYLPTHHGRGVLVLANNHTMDYGEVGLLESLARLESANFLYVGAGRTKKQAQNPVIFDWSEIRVGVLARCETQFGVATDTKPGVAEFDATIYSQIKKLKREADVVIVSIHAAAEMVPWPSPRRQNVWRSLVEAGADIVHGHHSHVPQGWERYGNGLICYGLGNFCVDPEKWRWHPHGLWSFAPEFLLRSSGLEMMPKTAVVDDIGEKIRVRDASAEESVQHQRYLFNCNRPLLDPILLEGLWQEGSIRMYHGYYSRWLGFDLSLKNTLRGLVGDGLRKLNRSVFRKNRFFTVRHDFNTKYLLWYHMFACESHNDAIATALGVISGELEDRRSKETSLLADEMMILSDVS